MENSEKQRNIPNSKTKVNHKNNIKGKKIKDKINQEEIIIKQNQSTKTKNQQSINSQDPSSINSLQNQQMIYAQPVIIANSVKGVPQACIINQTKDLKIKVGSKPRKIECPYCHQPISTITENNCNCASFLAYILIFLIPPIFMIYITCINIEECRCECGCDGSDNGCCFPTCCKCPNRHNLDDCLCCCDVTHSCPSCGGSIGKKDACSDICPSSCC